MSDFSACACAAVVLAAGASKRLGQPKQLIQLNGESLLHHTARLAEAAGCNPVFVVLGFETDRIEQEIRDLGVKTVINPDWQSGMASSLRCGMQELMKQTPLPQRVLLLVCDQARLSTEILFELIRASEEKGSLITAASYAGKLGVPAIFDRQFFPDLMKIEGDQGARALILQHLHQTFAVEFPAGTVDIDTPQDLASLQAISKDKTRN